MKQAENPIIPKFGNKPVNSKDITEEEMVCQLEKSFKDAIMLSAKKKEFLLDLLKNKKDPLEQCKLFDSVMDSNLFQAVSILQIVHFWGFFM